MAKQHASEQVQVNFRMPVDLRDRIKVKAERDGYSMGAAIVEALERAFPKPRTPKDVVDEVAQHLAFFPEKLRIGAIELLREASKDGYLERRVQIERHMMKDTEISYFNDE